MSQPRIVHRQRGVTLVELMVAMVLGLIVAGGIVTLFLSTSSSNRAQTQMARLQEEGRYAITRISADLKMAGAQYCNSTGGIATAGSSGVSLDGLRAPRVLANNLTFPQNTTPWGGSYPAKPTASYYLPSFFFMRGFQCTKTACTPSSPPTAANGVPAMGTAVGSRVVGAAVLQLRYIDSGRGWAIGGASQIVANNDGTIANIAISKRPEEPDLTGINSAGEMMMLADCSSSQIFQTTGNPTFVPAGSTVNFEQPKALKPQSAPKLFRVSTDFRTVTYFLQVVSDDGTATGTKTGALMRCDSTVGSTCQELVRGVERLDFNYGVEDQNGFLHYLSAADVDSRAGSTIPCPAGAKDSTSTDMGCLWRALKTVEVNILMDGQAPLYTLQAPDLVYAYSPEGNSTPKAPDARGANGISPSDQGFALPMLRRQFSTVVMMRNYNP
ncbi:PilW family protein [Luteibacter aegosomatis]|uniref:PilW family protein n=1 Tax=Luteibacter aegosomatis TaxID=2911537 RepID=UPI001FF78626|nr:PilW family protein [Luteibacter aegosomatis]UPG87069.1 PilW family protein [Luteibacter aegosomatis]